MLEQLFHGFRDQDPRKGQCEVSQHDGGFAEWRIVDVFHKICLMFGFPLCSRSLEAMRDGTMTQG